MKKKILCLALCVVMVASLLVGCGEKNRDEVMNKIGKDTSDGAVTLTMQILAEDAVSKEQETLVENAVNDIFDTYNIKLDLKYYTAENYYKVLEENFKTMKEFFRPFQEHQELFFLFPFAVFLCISGEAQHFPER